MKVCLNCKDRQLDCHSNCGKYKSEKENIEHVRKKKDEYLTSYRAMFNQNRR